MSTATQAPLGNRLMGGAYDLTGATTADEARAAAGLAWEASHVPLFIEDCNPPLDGSDVDPAYIMVEKERAVVRSDNCEVLGIVGREHQLLSNADFFDFADVLLREAEGTWASADPVGGSLAGGRLPFLCLQLGEGIQVAGQDAVNCAVLLADGKVGNSAFRGIVNPLRVACGNQVRSSLKRLGLSQFSIQHSGDLATKVADARMGLAITSNYMREFEAMANRMAEIDIDAAAFSDFLAELVPIPSDAGDRAKATAENQRMAFRANWRDSLTLTPDLRGTAWGALNLVTEVLDYGDIDVRRSKVPTPERRMNSIHFGSAARVRDRAYQLLSGV